MARTTFFRIRAFMWLYANETILTWKKLPKKKKRWRGPLVGRLYNRQGENFHHSLFEYIFTTYIWEVMSGVGNGLRGIAPIRDIANFWIV